MSAEEFRIKVAYLVAIWEGDEPGSVNAETGMAMIADMLGNACSICRRRHGLEKTHAHE